MTSLSCVTDVIRIFLNDFNQILLALPLDIQLLHQGGFMSILGFKYLSILILFVSSFAEAFAQSYPQNYPQNTGNDVYNFYFQKGEAPQNVYQGGGGQDSSGLIAPASAPSVPAPPATAPSTEQSQQVVEAAPPPKRDYNFYEIHLGPTRISDSVGQGTAYTLGGQLNFNRYLGTRLQGQYLASESADYSRPVKRTNQASNRWGGLAALVFTPLRMDLVGHSLIRISALSGVRSERRFKTADQIQTRVEPFVGASVGVSLNENVGIEGSVAMVDGGKIGQATGSLVFSF
jgi:hypothetical protein